jgi:pyruvoyl-dependent arginine decarboxylase
MLAQRGSVTYCPEGTGSRPALFCNVSKSDRPFDKRVKLASWRVCSGRNPIQVATVDAARTAFESSTDAHSVIQQPLGKTPSMFPSPKAFFLTRGIGVHKEQLTAFELALRDADIEQQNLVTVSSILPPACVEMERDAGVATLHPGEITFAVMARTETNEPGQRINASIGLALGQGDSSRKHSCVDYHQCQSIEMWSS